MPEFELVAPFQPTGDQPQAIEKLADGLARGLRHQTLLGATGTRQDVHDRERDRPPQAADARARPQQDAGGAALQRVPRLLPEQRGRVLRELLRLLPAGGLSPALRHVHREGLEPERGDRQASPRRDEGAVRAQGRDHRRVGQLHLRPGGAGRLRRDRPAPADGRPVPARRRPAAPRGPPVPAQRPGAPAIPLPRPGRHAGARAVVRGPPHAARVLRGRDRADHGAGPADRRADRRAHRAQRVPRDPLRDAGRQAPARDGDDRGGAGGAACRPRGRGPGARSARGSASARRSTSR